jgi:hypothetical protein
MTFHIVCENGGGTAVLPSMIIRSVSPPAREERKGWVVSYNEIVARS